MPEKHDADSKGRKDDAEVGHEALADALQVSFRFLKIGMGILIIVYLLQGFFYVSPNEVAIKLSFGRPVKANLGPGRGEGYVLDSQSGWHYCWPWQEVKTIPLGEQSVRLNKAFSRGSDPGGRNQPTGFLNVAQDNYLITGDANIIHMKLRGRYRARSDQQGAFDYAFRIKSPAALLEKFIIESTIETVSTWGVLDVRSKRKEVIIQTGSGQRLERLALFEQIEERVQEKLKRFQEKNNFTAGIELISIEPIEDPEVPLEVQDAFDMAQQAESEMDRLIQEARREARNITQTAMGNAAEMLGEAEAYKNRLAANARADAAMLENLLKVYKESPEKAAILREWHYARMVEELLGNADRSFVLHKGDENTKNALWLKLGRPQRKSKESSE
jgi:membrane protease subunit HflK